MSSIHIVALLGLGLLIVITHTVLRPRGRPGAAAGADAPDAGVAAEPAIPTIDELLQLDAEYFRRTAGALEAAGFRKLGDMRVRLLEPARATQLPAIARVLTDDEGTVTAAVYHARVSGAPAGDAGSFHAIELDTPLDDGTFLTTSTAPAAGIFDGLPQVRSECLAADTDVCTLLERHRLRVAEWLRTRPAVSPLRSRSIEDVIRHRQRLDELHAAAMAGTRRSSAGPLRS